MADPQVFVNIYDRVVRRFWSTGEPISEREFKAMVEAEGLKYPGNRDLPPPAPHERLRLRL